MDDRRKHTRLAKEYRLEYGPFSSLFNQEQLKTGVIKNLSGGGVLFSTPEELQIGNQIYLKIYITGWEHENGDYIQVSNDDSELLLNSVAEIIRVQFDPQTKTYKTGARFMGQVHEK